VLLQENELFLCYNYQKQNSHTSTEFEALLNDIVCISFLWLCIPCCCCCRIHLSTV